jgi:hypothetical protein
MPLYLSNTNRIESLLGDTSGGGRGTNSTTTTTLTPPLYSFIWGVSGFGSSNSSFNVQYPIGNITDISVSGSWEISPALANLNSYFLSIQTATPGAGMYKAPFGIDFNVQPAIFGKIATFTNTATTESREYKLATYIPWSGSEPTYEFVPPSSSIQRCVTYPAYTYFSGPITGANDTAYLALLGDSNFGSDCSSTIDCFCSLCFQNYDGGSSILSGSQPCSGSGTTTTTTSTTTTSTTTTSTTTTTTTSTTTTSTTTTTAAPIVSYSLEYLIIGGGGGAGSQDSSNNNLGSGGGGAGGYVSGSLFVTQSQAYSFVVGTGGGSDVSGTNSSAFSLTATGGGFGAPAGPTALAGGNGGSGGGGGSRGGVLSVNAPGNGSGSQGFGGGDATQESVGAGGGGGGASSAGSTPSADTYGGGGAGKLWFRGITYSAGGNAAGRGTTKFSATNASANTGDGGGGIKATGGGAGGSGGSGTVAVRYVSGSASATGGTIINDGGYTYHYFTGSGTFTA